MDQCGSALYTKNTKAKVTQQIIKYWVTKIQVLGLLGRLSSYIAAFALDAYRTVSLTVTLLTTNYDSVMRILILRRASHLDAFSGYPTHT